MVEGRRKTTHVARREMTTDGSFRSSGVSYSGLRNFMYDATVTSRLLVVPAHVDQEWNRLQQKRFDWSDSPERVVYSWEP
jgi:hypothetical protein